MPADALPHVRGSGFSLPRITLEVVTGSPMLQILGSRAWTCEGPTRRAMLTAGGAGLLGLSLPRVEAAESIGESGLPIRAKNVVFINLFGGPCQLETFDLKPEAPDNVRGPFRPIGCRTPGLLIGERLPKLADISDKFAVLRTMSHDFNDHSGGAHYIQTGRRWHVPIGGGFNATPRDWPSMGSVVEHLAQQAPDGLRREVPGYMCVPNRLGRIEQQGQYLRPGQYGGWLGRACDPLSTVVDKKTATDNPYFRDCSDDELTFRIEGLSSDVTLDALSGRASLLDQLESERRRVDEIASSIRVHNRHRERAHALVASPKTRTALDILQEPAETRDRYGRHLLGQSCLMARRLLEAGVRFVTVHYDAIDGYSWDSHVHSDDVKNHLLPTFDQACAALLTDLDQRGLLAETLVIALGEMGRTPRANARWGRDHWSTLFSILIAGGGVRGGTVHGKTDRIAAYALDNPTKPEDLAATVYWALGIDPHLQLPDSLGRPLNIVEGGTPASWLFG